MLSDLNPGSWFSALSGGTTALLPLSQQIQVIFPPLLGPPRMPLEGSIFSSINKHRSPLSPSAQEAALNQRVSAFKGLCLPALFQAACPGVGEGLSAGLHSYEVSEATQSCPTLRDPWNSLGQSTGVDSHSLLQGIFPTQG